MESILTSIKKMLGIAEEIEAFDPDLIMYINSFLSVVGSQLFGTPSTPCIITDKTTEWSDFLPADGSLEFIKTYIFLKVKMVFDPPSTAALLEATKKMIDEHEFRIIVATETATEVIPEEEV